MRAIHSNDASGHPSESVKNANYIYCIATWKVEFLVVCSMKYLWIYRQCVFSALEAFFKVIVRNENNVSINQNKNPMLL